MNYEGPERRVVDTERILRLEAATNHLAGQVSGLSAALETVNRISSRQQELEQETRIATAALRSVNTRTERLQSELMPRRELRHRDRERWIVTGGAVLVAIHAHEITRNSCGGSRLDQPVPGADGSQPGVLTSTVCDVFWPEATNFNQDWPSGANLVGFLLYALLATYMIVTLRRLHLAARRTQDKNC